ncbi:YicC family protein [Rhodocaloribacter litoris]|uniref:YicC/YloC family endoribonuclease n=1 Tax=Rhodocaloribacter litoris TaxID=2558931 RepID=UPI001421A2A4|nr:YicC/YloC family endoribonuclease [Rhodocaloribacter litoris]QXD13794.1 YicC family protein [Rhodocaloribacter litoris]
MIASMTGFGRGSAEADGFAATVEMRSVNSRFCEVSVRLPRVLSEYEGEIQRLVKQAFARGRINVNVQLTQTGDDVLPLRVNPEAARAYARLLESARDAAGLDGPVRLEHLLQFSDIFIPVEAEEDVTGRSEQAWAVVRAALETAVEALRAMRRQEGQALQAELAGRIDAIETLLEAVEAQAPARVEQARRRLHDRLEELLGDDRLDAERLEFEIALLADKLDVTEECVRLRSHLALFRESLAGDEPVGRKLNFLAQEMNREVNTIGSKANDATIAHLVVRMKEELEKIREQIENTE